MNNLNHFSIVVKNVGSLVLLKIIVWFRFLNILQYILLFNMVDYMSNRPIFLTLLAL